MRLRDSPGLLEAAVQQAATSTGIPARQVRKDYWLTEILRAVAAEAEAHDATLVFKGGTSLSKVFRLIERFSEDVDVLLVAAGGTGAVNTTMKAMERAAENHTGVAGVLNTHTVDTGTYRAVTFGYPGRPADDVGVLLEIGARGGAIPTARHQLCSIVATTLPTIDGQEVEEASPFEVVVLSSARTLVEKLVVLHDAASRPATVRSARIAKTVRHYYDVWCLLNDVATCDELERAKTSVLAREVCQHSRAIGFAAVTYPKGGFARAPAFQPESTLDQRRAFDATVKQLLWPNATMPSFDDCLSSVTKLADIL